MRILLALMVGCGVHAACATEFPWDLRGMLRVEGEPLVNVADPATGQSMWMVAGQEFQGWKFEGLDATEARAVFRKGTLSVQVDLVPTRQHDTDAPLPSYRLPPGLATHESPLVGDEHAVLVEGVELLLGDAPREAWEGLARRRNATLYPGYVQEDGSRVFMFFMNEPGRAPEVRERPINPDGTPGSLSMGDDPWVLVSARPFGERNYNIAVAKSRGRPPPQVSASHPAVAQEPGESIEEYVARVQRIAQASLAEEQRRRDSERPSQPPAVP